MTIATIEININAIYHNIKVLKEHSQNSQMMAVVKANAYGHGKSELAQKLEPYVDYFGVARLEEAIALRDCGVKIPIVLLEGFFPHDDIQQLIDYNLQTVVHSLWQIEYLQSLSSNSRVRVWFKLDTGMHRLGFHIEQAKYYFSQLVACSCVDKPINIMSHFCLADVLTSDYTIQQIALFDQFIQSIDNYLIGEQSMAASCGILAWATSHRDMVRAGIALYGVSPFSYQEPNKGTGERLGLKPAMILKSELIAVRTHQKGEGVSYGLSWQSKKETKLGVVAIGYGDGYPRDIKPNTKVWLNNRLVSVVGRVCMDMILVDLGYGANDQVGDEVILWGIHELPVEKVAANANMSAYELLTRLTSRIKIDYS